MADIQTAVEHVSNATIAKGGAVVSLATGSGAAASTYFDISTVVSLAGGALAIVAALVSIYFAFRDDRRKEREHLWRLREATPTGLNSPSEL
jgi:hypothetical protein